MSLPTLFAEEPLPLTMAAHQKRCYRGQNKISTALRQENWVDAHLMAEVMDVFCDDLASKPWKISNAISLIRLDDGDSARVILRELMASSETDATSSLIFAWSFLRIQDTFAFDKSLKRVSFKDDARLRLIRDVGHPQKIAANLAKNKWENSRVISKLHDDFLKSQSKNPWLAGGLSAVLPGAGQAYSGSWDAAAISFVLNVILIGATVELIRDDKYFSAGATGVVGSMFYLGNVFNAIDLSKRRNKRSSKVYREKIEAAVLPEIYPQ